MINDFIEYWFSEIIERQGKDSGPLREKVRAVALRIAERLKGCDFQTAKESCRAPYDEWVNCVWPQFQSYLMSEESGELEDLCDDSDGGCWDIIGSEVVAREFVIQLCGFYKIGAADLNEGNSKRADEH